MIPIPAPKKQKAERIRKYEVFVLSMAVGRDMATVMKKQKNENVEPDFFSVGCDSPTTPRTVDAKKTTKAVSELPSQDKPSGMSVEGLCRYNKPIAYMRINISKVLPATYPKNWLGYLEMTLK